MPQSGDFDIAALYAALDAHRHARGLSWRQATQQINAQFENPRGSQISVATVSGMRARTVVEGDGVLQMLRWLHRTPESFIPGYEGSGAELPDVGANRILRFDVRAIYAALNAQRTQRGMTWNQVASEIGGVNSGGLTRLSRGGRVGFPQVMRIVHWLGRPAATFTRASDW